MRPNKQFHAKAPRLSSHFVVLCAFVVCASLGLLVAKIQTATLLGFALGAATDSRVAVAALAAGLLLPHHRFILPIALVVLGVALTVYVHIEAARFNNAIGVVAFPVTTFMLGYIIATLLLGFIANGIKTLAMSRRKPKVAASER